MQKVYSLFFLFLTVFLFSEEEVHISLNTRSSLQPIYLTKLYVGDDQIDWRYPEEMRAILAFDLSNNGFSSLMTLSDECEEKILWPQPRNHFNLPFWRSEKIPFVISVQTSDNTFIVTAFNIYQGTSKTYPEIPLTNDPQIDRPAIHQLADTLTKDLFHEKGVASEKILFSQRVKNTRSNDAEWFSEIWIADWDGANAKRLTMGQGYCITPYNMPNSIAYGEGEFYFVSTERSQSKIYRSSFPGSKPEPMIRLRGSQLLPSISHDGKTLAFISDAAGRPDLFIQKLGDKGKPIGKPRQLFSAPFATQASPTFNPKGDKLAFVSDKDGTARIYLLDILDAQDTTKARPQLISKKNRGNTSPSWSPDGSKLAYSSLVDGKRQIWIYDFVTQKEWPLTSGEKNKENPSWASNSLHLIYNTETHEESELYLINIHQKEPVCISSGFGQKRFPSWSPSSFLPPHIERKNLSK